MVETVVEMVMVETVVETAVEETVVVEVETVVEVLGRYEGVTFAGPCTSNCES